MPHYHLKHGGTGKLQVGPMLKQILLPMNPEQMGPKQASRSTPWFARGTSGSSNHRVEALNDG